jgi:carbamoyltransferase
VKVLGITLGHDASFSLVEDHRLAGMLQAERWFRQKHYKLHCLTREPGRHVSGYQLVSLDDLDVFLGLVAAEWGTSFDAVAVQNQGRSGEYDILLEILGARGFAFQDAAHLDHHLCHAAEAFYTSPFEEALILSYDGGGNDGFTVLFKADAGGLTMLDRVEIHFGASYNNLGFIAGVKPDISGTSAGKTMGLAAYGRTCEDWLPHAREYVRSYRKRIGPTAQSVTPYGASHVINPVGLERIPALRPFLVPVEARARSGWRRILLSRAAPELRLPGPEDELTQDLVHTVQHAWTQEVLVILERYRATSRNLCIVGGCALNGITNFAVQERGLFDRTFFVPNPTDDGLSAGAALLLAHRLRKRPFAGYEPGLSPYLGAEAFDRGDLPTLKRRYPHRELAPDEAPRALARLVYDDRMVGVVRGRYEIGPRALGNRSIFCNPLHPGMRELLNEKVKHREWYRPFAPIAPAEDAATYFTNVAEIPYMSVICHARKEWRERLPAVTHVDGSTRLQTLRRSDNEFVYDALREFERLAGVPIMLNTSFNPGGEPILNYCSVALEMLEKTSLDLVLIDETLFCRQGNEELLALEAGAGLARH